MFKALVTVPRVTSEILDNDSRHLKNTFEVTQYWPIIIMLLIVRIQNHSTWILPESNRPGYDFVKFFLLTFLLHSGTHYIPITFTNTFNIVTLYKCFSTDKYNNLFAYIPITFRLDWETVVREPPSPQENNGYHQSFERGCKSA